MSAALNVRGVSVDYGRGPVLLDVDLTVDGGEWVAVLGPNGAGKSTLLRTIVGERPTSGRVAIANEDVATTKGRARAQRVAYVPQVPTFPAGMTVFDYVLLGRTPHMGPLAAESADDIGEVWGALRDLDLVDFVDRDVATLSGGETQRVSMARVLAQRAPILVLDEATASLDVARQHQVLELVDEVRNERNLAVIAAMHDLTAASQFADRVLVLDGGSVVALGRPDDVLTEELLQEVYEPSVRVLEVEGSRIITSMRSGAKAERQPEIN